MTTKVVRRVNMMRDETEESCWCCLTCDDAQVGFYPAHQSGGMGAKEIMFWCSLYGRVMDDVELTNRREKTVLIERRHIWQK